ARPHPPHRHGRPASGRRLSHSTGAAMRIDGRHTRTIWPAPDGRAVEVIDQTALPHRYVTVRLATMEDAARAILTMQVRGAPLIGATAAYGLAFALRDDASDPSLA